MTSDGELLQRYAETRSEEAFTELVQRHLNLVYSAALRQVNGDAHLAQDVTQSVFAGLAGKANTLTIRSSLAGWLYKSAHFIASKAVRTEQRRHAREWEAHTMQPLHESDAPVDWEKLQPHIDAAMHDLEETEREVILLRYFQSQPHREIGERIGLSENAARMRVERALEKLQSFLKQRGVTTSAAALGTTLVANAVQTAPAGLLPIMSAVSAAGLAAKTIVNLKIAAALVTALLTCVTVVYLVQDRKIDRLQNENEHLVQQHAQVSSEHQAAVVAAQSNREQMERLKSEQNDLLRLRNEVATLRRQISDMNQNAGAQTAASQPPLPAVSKTNLVAKINVVRVGRNKPAASPESIRDLISVKEGDVFDPKKSDADVRKIWATDLMYNVRMVHQQTLDGFVLNYAYFEKPTLTAVRFTDNGKDQGKELAEMVRSKVGGLLDEKVAFNDVEGLKELYKTMGYSGKDVRTVTHVNETTGLAELIFETVDASP